VLNFRTQKNIFRKIIKNLMKKNLSKAQKKVEQTPKTKKMNKTWIEYIINGYRMQFMWAMKRM
jgi:hypothetical protein